ncbi:MAG: hypothetical protein FWB99_08000 [Treponema sp.]|nr:hypothetical protein [Treponema sp.]
MTLGDLLRQDGALALLAIGAVLGFFAGMLFRARAKKTDSAAVQTHLPMYAPLRNTAIIAAITAAVNKYQNENV